MIRKLFGFLALIVGLSACQVTVSYTTTIIEDGSGSFAFKLVLDQEASEQLGDQRTPSLFNALAADGWTVTREEPDGGLLLMASHDFASAEELPQIFNELGSAREEGGAGEFGGINLTLSADQRTDPVTTSTDIEGNIDFGTLQDLDAATKAELGRSIFFEIIADLPGDARVSEGDASIDSDGVVVWRPRFGAPMQFAASSTVREPTIFMGLLLGGGGLFLLVLLILARSSKKKRRHQALESFRMEQTTGLEGFEATRTHADPEPIKEIEPVVSWTPSNPFEPREPMDLFPRSSSFELASGEADRSVPEYDPFR